jgi:hypothetical protein
MRYVVILLVGILLGAGAAIFFLGVSPAKSAPGQAVRAPDQGGTPPATVVVTLEQSFVEGMLATTFSGLGAPTFNLGQNHRDGFERVEQALFQGGCANTITLLPEGSGVKTGVQFRDGNIYVPMAFTGSYNLGGCLQFKGWAQNKIKLTFDQEKQVLYGVVDVEGVNLEGVNPLANNFVTVFVQSAINQKVNPLLLINEPQLSLMIPVKASNGAVKARAKDVRAEILNGSLKLYVTYEFSGMREGAAG